MIAAVVVALAVGPVLAVAPAGTAAAQEPSPDPLDRVVDTLRTTSPGTEGSVWFDTSGNRLQGPPEQWWLQSPRCWGQPDCATRPGTEELLAQLRDTVAAATTSIDLTTLWPFPDGGFRDALVEGLRAGLAAGHRPRVRLLAGTPVLYSYTGIGPDEYRRRLIADIGPAATSLQVAVATSTTALRSWNHAKIVAVDGRTAIVGGHNMWAASYLSATPVSDVSMRIEGPAAAAATRFVDLLWSDVCARRLTPDGWWWIRYSASPTMHPCPRTTPQAPTTATPGGLRVLAVGRLGLGLAAPGVGLSSGAADAWSVLCPGYADAPQYERRNPGRTAARALIGAATESVFISQQDLLAQCPRFDPLLFDVLADRIAAGVRTTIVVTGAFGTSYANMESLYDLSEQLYASVLRLTGDAGSARAAVCSNVQLASLRTGTSATWPDGAGFANHAKFIMVDDSAFSVGSDNLYPASLQELDLVVGDRATAAQVREVYLDPLWRWSRPTAVIDPDQGRCQITPPD